MFITLYVALSRVTTLEGLHILNLNEEEICVSSKVEGEMARLRTSAYLVPYLDCFREMDDNYVKILFLKVRSLHKHYLDVKNDIKLYIPINVAIFGETRLGPLDRNEEFEIGNFTLYRNDAVSNFPNRRPFYGSVIYCSLQCVAGYPKCHNVFGVEITITKLQCFPSVVIAGIYRSPNVCVSSMSCTVLFYVQNSTVLLLGI